MKFSALRLIVLLFLLSTFISAQTQPALGESLKNDIVGKTVVLRGMFSGDSIVFDEKGELTTGNQPGSWTLYGIVSITDLKLDDGGLHITGTRQAQKFDSKKKDFVDVAWKPVTIDVKLPPAMHNPQVLGAALNGLFASKADLKDLVAPEWRFFFSGKTFEEWLPAPISSQLQGPKTATMQATSTCMDTLACGKSTEAVTMTLTTSPKPDGDEPQPQLPADGVELARSAKIGKDVAVVFVVSPEGEVRYPSVAMPVGLGLDEAVVAAVAKQRYKPGKYEGKAVAMAASAEVPLKIR